jgi:hypothetical protein
VGRWWRTGSGAALKWESCCHEEGEGIAVWVPRRHQDAAGADARGSFAE